MPVEHGTVVVTGGSTGIGAAICRLFLDSGHEVANLALEPLALEHPRLHNYPVDLSNREATATRARQVAEQHEVTSLVHNAGLIRPDLMPDVQLEDYDYLSRVHIGAAITLGQAFLPTMRARGFGRIIFISSRAALGLQTRTSYSATKAGLMGMARTWALELGEYGITVNTVAPGPIAGTEMFHQVIPEGSPKLEEMARGIPVKRLGLPEDIARAVSFFNDPDNGFVTGQTLMVCGGSSLGSLSL